MVKVIKVAGARKTAAPKDSGKSVSKVMNVVVHLNLAMSIGNGDRQRTIEEWQKIVFDAVRNADKSAEGDARLGGTGMYYIINGRACLPDDYDPETHDFKPGTHPPHWASTETERKQWEILDRVEREKSLPALARHAPNLKTAGESLGRSTATVDAFRSLAATRSGHFDWDAKQARDTALAAKVAKEATDKLTAALTGGKKKKVIRLHTEVPQKTIRIKKKG